MRPLLLAAFLSSTALVASASGQVPATPTPTVIPGGEVQGRAAIIECDKLATLLETSRPANPGVTVEQVSAWRAANDATACQQNLERLTQAAAAGSSGAGIRPVTTQANPPSGQTPPATTAGTAPGPATSAPQVVVQQAQPSVTIRQQQPEVIVRIPPPIITVQQPQPEIVVRMPEPDVSVSVARPEVQVTMPQPQIQVVPPQQALAKPDVQRDAGQPNVRVERTGEPRIVYQQAEGQPQVRFEPMSQASATAPAPGAAGANASPAQPAGALTPRIAQAQLNGGPASPARPGEPQQTGAVQPPSQPMDVAKIEDMALYNARGDKMGDVEEVVTGPGNAMFVVITHGGFLGLGQKQVAMPIDQLAMRGDRLVAESLTDDQIKAMPSFDDDDRNYKEAEDGQTASVRVLQ